jgi:hypothetical protein
MEWIGAVAALLAVLFLVGRGIPRRSMLLAIAVALALVVLVVAVERAGLWPQGWRTR